MEYTSDAQSSEPTSATAPSTTATSTTSSSDPFSHSAPWSPQLFSPTSSDLSQQPSPVQLMFPSHATLFDSVSVRRPGSSSSLHSRPQTSQLSLNLSALSMGGGGGGADSPAVHHSPTELSPTHDGLGGAHQQMYASENVGGSSQQSQYNSWFDDSQHTLHHNHHSPQLTTADPSPSSSSIRIGGVRKRPLPASMDQETLQEAIAQAQAHHAHHSHLDYPHSHHQHQHQHQHPVGLGILHHHHAHDPSMGINPHVLGLDDPDMGYSGPGGAGDPDEYVDDDSPDSGSSDPPEPGPLNLISAQGGTGVSLALLGRGIKLPSAGLEMAGGANGNNGCYSRPPPMNNFVTKLYNMILDPKAAPFISWTEMGASFVVCSITEFSRTVLGSHFKHNNFSSFVRQLNMYGFHKINRTPRASRTSPNDQTWEFSHPKFLRGRPDLLDEIKRKALEPELTARQRVELPAEVASQLGKIEEQVRQLRFELQNEREKNQRLVGFVRSLYDWFGQAFPGQVPIAFPTGLLDSPGQEPHIFVSPASDGGLASAGGAVAAATAGNAGVGPAYLSSFGASHAYYPVPAPFTLTPQSTPTSSEFPDPSSRPLGADDDDDDEQSTAEPTDRSGRFMLPPPSENRYMRRHVSLDEVAAHNSSHHVPFGAGGRSRTGTVFESNNEADASSPTAPEAVGVEGTTTPSVMLPPVPSLPSPPRTSAGRGPSKRHRPNPSPSLDSHLSTSASVPDGLSPLSATTPSIRKLQRARSDSAPLGYGLEAWAAANGETSLAQVEVRPRSGTVTARQRGERTGYRLVTPKIEGRS